jgi:hypothetical protein
MSWEQPWRALQAGATWEQVAAATGRGAAEARRDYRQWAADEHRLWVDSHGEYGMDAAEYARRSRELTPPPSSD